MTQTTDTQKIDQRNADLVARMRDAIRDYGSAKVYLGGTKIHAATAVTTGHGGYRHPRPKCQAATSRTYGILIDDQSQPVTCQRCLAALGQI